MKKITSALLMVGIVALNFGFFSPKTVMAASVTTTKDVMSRSAASTASDHTITFVTPTGIAAGQSISLTFSSGFTGVSGILFSDVDFASGDTNVCSTATYTEKTLAGTPATTTWGVTSSGQVVTILSGTDTVAASKCLRIKIGTNATNQTTGTHQITNGVSGAADTITIGGTFTDTGVISVEIMDNDQVSVTATVDQTMSFDLDTGLTAGETASPYSVPLGTLSSGTVTHSDGSSIKQIFADGGTNASGGMNVSVRNINGAQGLKSTSTPADYIPSATATMAAGTPNYGLCVDSATPTGFARSTTYNTTCTLASGTNAVVGLTTTATDILTSSAPVTGHAQILVNAAIQASTPAHADYTDSLIFVATASF